MKRKDFLLKAFGAGLSLPVFATLSRREGSNGSTQNRNNSPLIVCIGYVGEGVAVRLFREGIAGSDSLRVLRTVADIFPLFEILQRDLIIVSRLDEEMLAHLLMLIEISGVHCRFRVLPIVAGYFTTPYKITGHRMRTWYGDANIKRIERLISRYLIITTAIREDFERPHILSPAEYQAMLTKDEDEIVMAIKKHLKGCEKRPR